MFINVLRFMSRYFEIKVIEYLNFAPYFTWEVENINPPVTC